MTTMDLSQPNISRLFFERLAPNLSGSTLIDVICATYQVPQNSGEMYHLLHAQRSNLLELLSIVQAGNLKNSERGNFSSALLSLIRSLDYGGLTNQSSQIYKQLISPYLRDLDYLSGRFSLNTEANDNDLNSVKDLSKELSKVRDKVEKSNISLDDKIHVLQGINSLLFFIDNIEVVGVRRAWEKAVITLADTAVVAQKDEKDTKGIIKKILGILGATTLVLATINGFVGEAGKSRDLLIEAFEQAQKLTEKPPLLIEDQ
ncbi:hypothetical protein CLF39_26925, partial [Salmonella enterica subsp. enterica serovar Kottbus]|nr:hypothetical protein [Salmonella enterica subsp. enterica serovar Kottbus]